MSDILYLAIVVNLVGLYYQYNFYIKKKEDINKIRLGNLLYISNCILNLLILNMIIFNKQDWYYFYFLTPLIIASAWFSFQYYKQKNSIYDYIYLGITIILAFLILYYLYI